MEITKELLEKQIADLEALEKQAWAQVNYFVGQKDMCLRLLQAMEKEGIESSQEIGPEHQVIPIREPLEEISH